MAAVGQYHTTISSWKTTIVSLVLSCSLQTHCFGTHPLVLTTGGASSAQGKQQVLMDTGARVTGISGVGGQEAQLFQTMMSPQGNQVGGARRTQGSSATGMIRVRNESLSSAVSSFFWLDYLTFVLFGVKGQRDWLGSIHET